MHQCLCNCALMFALPLQVKNLRSQVARAAISCLADLFSCCGKMLEQVSVEYKRTFVINTILVPCILYLMYVGAFVTA